jgi:outer membrane protein assembly factor BamB
MALLAPAFLLFLAGCFQVASVSLPRTVAVDEESAAPQAKEAPATVSSDWPQWRGPNRDGVSAEKGLLKEWPKEGPKLLWTYKDAGEGYSCPAIVGDVLYTAGARDKDSYLFALNLKANPPKEKWALKIAPVFLGPNKGQWNKGPSTTPVVTKTHVYVLSGGGELVCADLTGKEVWRKNLPKDLGGEVNPIGGGPEKIGWGYAGSPLIDENQVVCVPGGPNGLFAALDTVKGTVLWQSKALKYQATYSSPVVATIGGVKQYIVTTQEGAASVDAANGDVLWVYKRSEPFGDIVAFTPIVQGDHVFISAAGEGNNGCDLIKVTKTDKKFSAAEVYSNKDLENFHGGAVLVGEKVYGASGGLTPRSSWVCMDFKTGKVDWSKETRKIGKGSVIAADGRLYCVGESTGVVALIEADPKKELSIVSSFKLPEEAKTRPTGGRIWTHPVLANGKLYLRDQNLIFCYEVK